MEVILSWETGFFTLGIFVFSWVARRALEAVFPTLRKDTPTTVWSRLWDDVILPSVPVVVGILIAVFMRNWPYPPMLERTGARVLYGAVCGFFSTWVYRVVKTLAYGHIRARNKGIVSEKDIEEPADDSIPPPPGT